LTMMTADRQSLQTAHSQAHRSRSAWSVSAASRSGAEPRVDGGARGSQAEAPHDCGRPPKATRATLRIPRRVRTDARGTTPTLSTRSEFTRTTLDHPPNWRGDATIPPPREPGSFDEALETASRPLCDTEAQPIDSRATRKISHKIGAQSDSYLTFRPSQGCPSAVCSLQWRKG
jgi:hypothetical protein